MPPSIALAVLALAAAPHTVRGQKVTQGDLGLTYSAWHPVSLLSGGTSIVSWDVRDPRGRFGSLEQVLPEGANNSAAVEIISEDAMVLPGKGFVAEEGFGRLSDLRVARYRWRRHPSSTTVEYFATAFRLMVHDPDQGERGSTWYLVYEPVYNGYLAGVPVDEWVQSDVAKGFVWRSPIFLDGAPAPAGWCAQNVAECYRYDRGPQDWGFGPNAKVIGVQLAVGSGWPGNYRGYVDDVRLKFKRRRRYRWNFEPM